MCPTNNNPRFRKYPPTVKGKNNPRNSQGMRTQQASNKQKDLTANIISIRRAELLGESAIQSYFEENPVRSFREQPADIRTKNVIGRRIKIEEMEDQFATQTNELNRTSFERVRYLPPPYVKTVTGVEAMREAHARLQFERHSEKHKKNFVDSKRINKMLSQSAIKQDSIPPVLSPVSTPVSIPSSFFPLSPVSTSVSTPVSTTDEEDEEDEEDEKGDPPAFIRRRGRKSRAELGQFRFGRLIIDEKKLLVDNETSLGFHPDTGLKSKPRRGKIFNNRKNISPEFKKTFLDILDGKKTVDVSGLSTNEKVYLANVIEVAEVGGVTLTGQGLFKNIKEIIQRFDVLTGMIRAGNNSKKIVNELSSVINQLVQTGTITVEHAINVTKSLIADI